MIRFATAVFARTLLAPTFVFWTFFTLPAAAEVQAPVSALLKELASRTELEPLKAVIVARGEVLVVDGCFCVRIKEVMPLPEGGEA